MSDIGTYEFFGSCCDRCESPIECLFLVGLLFLGEYSFEPFDMRPVIARDSMGIELGQQVRLGDEIRIDFTLARPGVEPRFAIEVDGYAFHGATPDQFAKDSARQRVIVSKGWTVIRFAGKEIMRDPRKCAAQAMAQITAVVDKLGAPPPKTAPMKARLRKPTDPELAELQERVEAAERSGDTNEAIRLAGAMRDRLRAILATGPKEVA